MMVVATSRHIKQRLMKLVGGAVVCKDRRNGANNNYILFLLLLLLLAAFCITGILSIGKRL